MKPQETGTRVGLISDTHGLLRPQAVEALRGSDLILHAGDIGKPEILDALRQLAPVVAVRGNIDREAWAAKIAEWELVQVERTSIYMLHDVGELAIDPAATGCRIVVSGHSHQPRIDKRGEVLFVNPGSAGPRRFKLPVSVARLQITGEETTAELITLSV
jgi:uncharacterized protein